MNEFFNFLSVRAFNAGAAAYRAQAPRHAPAFFGAYSSHWVNGWDEAFLASQSPAPSEFVVCY